MATTSILDELQPSKQITPITGQSTDGQDAQRLASEARLAQIKLEEQARQAERAKSEEKIAATVQAIRKRQADTTNLTTGRVEQAGAMAQENMVRQRSYATNPNIGSSAPTVYDPQRRTFVQGTQPLRTQANADLITNIKREMGYTPLGATLPPTTKAVVDVTVFDNPQLSLSPDARTMLAQSMGGSQAMQAYDSRVNSVVGNLDKNLSAVMTEDGLLDTKKMKELAIKDPSFTPSIVGEVGSHIEQMALSWNKTAEQTNALKSEIKTREYNMRQSELTPLRDNSFVRLARDIEDGKIPAMFPGIPRAMQDGLSAQEAVYYMVDKVQSPVEATDYRDAFVNAKSRELFDTPITDEVAGLSQISNADESRYTASIQKAGEYYAEAVRQNKDIRTYVFDKLAEDVGISGMDTAQGQFFLNRLYDDVNGVVSDRVNESYNTIRDQQTGQVKLQIENLAGNLGSLAQKSSDKAYDFSGDTWTKVRSASPQAQTEMLRGMFVDKLDAMYREQIGALSDPRQLGDMADTYQTYLSVLGTEKEDALANSDETFANIVALRDDYVNLGLTLAGSQELVQKREVEVGNQMNLLTAFDADNKPVRFAKNETGISAYNAFVSADPLRKKQIESDYASHVADEANKKELLKGELNQLKLGNVRIQFYGKSESGQGRYLSEAYPKAPESWQRPLFEAHWDGYMQYLNDTFRAHPEMMVKVMDEAIKAKEIWQEEKSKSMALAWGVSEAEALNRIKAVGEMDATGTQSKLLLNNKSQVTIPLALRGAEQDTLYVNSAGERQRFVPDAHYKKVKDGVMFGDRTYKPEKGAVWMVGVDSTTKLAKVIKASEKDVQEWTDLGFSPLGE